MGVLFFKKLRGKPEKKNGMEVIRLIIDSDMSE